MLSDLHFTGLAAAAAMIMLGITFAVRADSGPEKPDTTAAHPMPAHVELKLGTTFSNNMVVQREQDVTIWGEAEPGTRVNVKLGDQEAAATADAEGHWKATLKPLPVGGPYSATVTSGLESISLKNILSGDVWLCSGQSNMALSVSEDAQAAQMRAAAKALPNLRLLQIPRAGSDKPGYLVEARWQRADRGSIDQFSAVAFHLGLSLLADPNLKDVPIGLIDSSFGGTCAEAWTPKAALKGLKPSDYSFSMFAIPYGGLYTQMIQTLGPLTLKGVVWYQGESNSARAQAYPWIMTRLIAGWRQQFDRPKLPFIIVQLPTFVNLGGGYPFTWLREAQARIVQTVPDTGLVVTIDTTDGFNLHPRDKAEVGRRAALQAQRLAYHEDVVADGPTEISASAEGDAMRVTFNTHDGPLTVRGGGKIVRGFEIAGEDRVYHFADAVIDGQEDVVVSSPDVPSPRYVRYAWAAMPDGDLYNGADLPAWPFRTDKFKIKVPIEIEPVLPARRVANGLYDVTLSGEGNLASLGVAQEQFISNQLDRMSIGNFPGFWGPRQLQVVKQLTPTSIQYSDSGVSATYSFAKDAMTVRIENRAKTAKEKVAYHIHLADGVQVSPAGSAGGFELKRGKATITLTGVDKVANDAKGGGNVDLSIKGNSTATVVFKFGKE